VKQNVCERGRNLMFKDFEIIEKPHHTTRDPVFSKMHPYKANPHHFQRTLQVEIDFLRVNFALECSCGLDAADKEREREKK